MARMKPCVTETQEKMEQFLLSAHFDTMEIPLHEACVTFIQKNVGKYHLGSKSTMYNNLNDIIMRTGY